MRPLPGSARTRKSGPTLIALSWAMGCDSLDNAEDTLRHKDRTATRPAPTHQLGKSDCIGAHLSEGEWAWLWQANVG